MLCWSNTSKRAEARLCQRVARSRKAIFVQPPEIDALFKVHLHATGRLQRAVPAVVGIGRIVKTIWHRAAAPLGIDAGRLDDFRFNCFCFAGHTNLLKSSADSSLRRNNVMTTV